MRYEIALDYANEIVDLLRPFCDRIEIAGGVRRHKEVPHDIEIVCAPRIEKRIIAVGLIGEEKIVDENRFDICIKDAVEAGIFELGDLDKAGKKAPFGPRYYRLKYKGEKVDIFTVMAPAQWGIIFLIRTGNADFSHWFVQSGWNEGIKVEDGRIVRSGNVIPTPEEADAFKALGLEWIDPVNRNIEMVKELEAIRGIKTKRTVIKLA